MSKEEPKIRHSRQWVLVLVLGIFGVVFGFGAAFVNGLNSQANLRIIIPLFFAGWGIGYLMCVKIIRDLEKKR
jgi:hypothetical protein